MASAEKYEVLVPSELADLIPVYLGNRMKELETLREALGASDLQKMVQLGHRMKGVGEPYGFQPISSLGGRIEQCARDSNTESLKSLIAEYADYLTNVRVKYEPSA